MTTVVELPHKKHRGRRALIAVIVVIVVLVVAFFVADYFAKKYAESYVQQEVATALDLSSSTPVAVDLGSGSILLQAASGSINNVNVSVNPLVIDGLTGTATLTAQGVPLSSTTPVKALQVQIAVPETTIAQAITKVPSLAAFTPVVTLSGQTVSVNGQVSIFGFVQKIGVTMTPTVRAGVPTFQIESAKFDGATIGVAKLNQYIPGLTKVLQSGTSLCIADQLPKAFTLSSITVQGDSLVSTFVGDGVELNSDALTTKGVCPGK